MFMVDSGAATARGFQVFYSRRSNGPYYRWWYQHEVEQWRSSRVHADEVPATNLCSLSWKNTPPALQASVKDHYLE
jgi:hypothetical protein